MGVDWERTGDGDPVGIPKHSQEPSSPSRSRGTLTRWSRALHPGRPQGVVPSAPRFSFWTRSAHCQTGNYPIGQTGPAMR